jgi:hypothetical protein
MMVSEVGTKRPVDPESVRMTSLRRDGVETLDVPQDLARQAQGHFSLTVPTADLDPGTYEVRVVCSSTDRVAISTDVFVLQSA